MKDIKEKLLSTVKTGTVEYGMKKAVNKLYAEEPELVLVSKNCPQAMKDRIKYYCRINQTRYLESNYSSLDLGSICGRQHSVSVLTVLNPGESGILEGLE